MAKDLYEILNIPRDSDDKTIKQSFRRLSLKYHPDRQTGKTDEEKKEAEEKFKEISHAYEVLSDPEKKRNYDTFGDENGGGHSGFGGFNPFEGFNPFADFFGHRGGQQRQQSVQPGRDIQMKIPVTIKDIFNGTKRSVKYKKQVRCKVCHGAGGSGQKTCPKCHGTGRLITQQRMGNMGMSIREETCPLCHGTGFYVEKKCDHCGGSGFEKEEVKLDIEFPAGIQNGEYRVYPNKGSESKNSSGKNGEFIAIADYNIDTDKYEVEGLNVIEHIHIPYYKLLLGCSYIVNIPNGVSKTIKIKSCVKEGTIMRLSGEGIKREGQYGDYYVCIHYLIPDNLSVEERKKLEEINNLKNN